MDYFQHNPTETFNYEFCNDLNNVTDELQAILPKTNNPVQGWALESPKREFLILMNALEKLFFLDDNNEKCYINKTINKNFYSFERSAADTEERTGIILAIAPKTHYREIPNIKRLEVMEKELKAYPSQFLKIFTIKDVLFIYMNKQPTWEQMVKFKIIQWTLFKNKIKTPEPTIMEFLNAMLNKDLIEINRTINKIMNRTDFIELKHKELINVFRYGTTKTIRSLKNQIEDLNDKITAYENALNATITKLRERNITLAAHEANPEQDLKPLLKYLINHPYIKNIKPLSDKTILMYFEAPIIYFDKYILEKIYNKKSGNYRKILKIFIDNKYELITRCQIEFDTEYFKVSLKTIGDSNNLISHPHIDHFNCFGTHNKAVQESAAEGDYLGAIEQISQAVLNLNFSDTYVVDTMLSHLIQNIYKCTWRHKETGTMLSTEEVLAQYEET